MICERVGSWLWPKAVVVWVHVADVLNTFKLWLYEWAATECHVAVLCTAVTNVWWVQANAVLPVHMTRKFARELLKPRITWLHAATSGFI